MHAVDAGARRQHALSRHFRAGGELEHLIDAVQVGGVDVEQGPFCKGMLDFFKRNLQGNPLDCTPCFVNIKLRVAFSIRALCSDRTFV